MEHTADTILAIIKDLPRSEQERLREMLEGQDEQDVKMWQYLEDKKFKIYKAEAVSDETLEAVGAIVKADKGGLHLQVKDGIIAIKECQLEGKNRMDYKSFINGHQGLLGQVLK